MIIIWVYLGTFLFNLTAISRGLDYGESMWIQIANRWSLGRILPQLAIRLLKLLHQTVVAGSILSPRECKIPSRRLWVWGVCVCVCEICSSQGDSEASFRLAGVCMILLEIFLPCRMKWVVSAPNRILPHWAKGNAASPSLFVLGQII